MTLRCWCAIFSPPQPLHGQVEFGGERLQRIAENGDHLADLLARDDQRRREDEIVELDAVAADAPRIDDHAALIGKVEQALVGVLRLRQRREGVADRPPCRRRSAGPCRARRQRRESVSPALRASDFSSSPMAAAFSTQPEPLHLVQHREAGGAGQRIAGIGVAVLEAAHVEHRLRPAVARRPWRRAAHSRSRCPWTW